MKDLDEMTLIDTLDIGNSVYCDSCGKDYTDNHEKGGLLLGSKAYCPDCALEILPGLKRYNELGFVKGYCPEGMEYREWVLKMRNGNNSIKVYKA